MSVTLVEFDEIKPLYRMTQPMWLKIVTIMIVDLVLVVGAFLLLQSQDSTIHIALVIGLLISLSTLLLLGMMRQMNSGVWQTLLADSDYLYVIASRDGKQFLQFPWCTIKEIESGLYGLNKRGLIVDVHRSTLTGHDLTLMETNLTITEDQSDTLSFSIPTGVVRRDQVIQQLTALKHR